MSTLVFIEVSEGKVRKSSLEAVCYAKAMGSPVTAIVLGPADASEVDPGMFEKPPVLDRHDRLDERRRDVVEPDDVPLFPGPFIEAADDLRLDRDPLQIFGQREVDHPVDFASLHKREADRISALVAVGVRKLV